MITNSTNLEDKSVKENKMKTTKAGKHKDSKSLRQANEASVDYWTKSKRTDIEKRGNGIKIRRERR